MSTPLSRALYNWVKGYRQIKNAPLTREDYTRQWGDLGGATYDWGKNAYETGMLSGIAGQNPGDESVWIDAIGALEDKTPVGGIMGSVYAPPSGQGQPGTVPGPYGSLSGDMYDWAGDFKTRNSGRAPSREDFVAAWGEVGGRAADWVTATGTWPDRNTWTARVDTMLNSTPPGGSIGSAYTLAQTPQGKIDAANLALLNQQIANAKAAGAVTDLDAQQLAAQIANMPTVAQAQALIQQQIDNAKLQGSINQLTADKLKADLANMATPAEAKARRDADLAKINADIANLQASGALSQAQADKLRADIANMPTPEQAKAKFDAELKNLLSSGQLTDAQADLVRAQTNKIGADLAANPRDWLTSWFYQRGQQPGAAPPGMAPPPAASASAGPAFQGGPVGGTGPAFQGGPVAGGEPAPAQPPVPPWLKSLQTNKPLAQFGGTSGSLGGAGGLSLPDPNQINAKTYNRLMPSEQEALGGLASSKGWYIPDYISQMQRSWTKQNTNPVAMWQGF